MKTSSQLSEFGRYLINGLIATTVHYSVLSFNLNVLDFSSAGLANFIAAIAGITTSFLGSRYFVFRGTVGIIWLQVLKFCGLYGLIAVLHGAVLFFWTDWMKFDYRLGFLIATTIQISLSYFGNRRLVFTT